MFGSLILPTTTTTTTGGAAAVTRIIGGGIQSTPRDDHLSSIPNNYHSTMSFPSHNKLLPITRRRIRASSFTTPAAASASDTTTLPRVQLPSKPNNLYQILRIEQNASSLEIKTAYRKLAKQFHPDALPPPPPTTSSSSDAGGGGGARDFMAIHNAYATLSDPTERARYDLSIQIQTRRFHRYYSSFSTAVDGNEDRRSYGMQTTRRWETDQCW